MDKIKVAFIYKASNIFMTGKHFDNNYYNFFIKALSRNNDIDVTNFKEEKAGTVPNTKWKLNQIGKNWYIGETLHSGIGQGYFLSTPIQLCLMTAQLANGGFKIKPRMRVS